MSLISLIFGFIFSSATTPCLIVRTPDGITSKICEGRRVETADLSGQRRLFGTDGSITIIETDGKIWKL